MSKETSAVAEALIHLAREGLSSFCFVDGYWEVHTYGNPGYGDRRYSGKTFDALYYAGYIDSVSHGMSDYEYYLTDKGWTASREFARMRYDR